MSGVGITGLIKPLNGATFPVWEDIDGFGGYRSEPNAAARDAIPDNFRKIGLCVFLQDTGETWQLTTGITNADWSPFGSVQAVVPLKKEVWVDGASAAGGNGAITTPFNTIQAAINSLASALGGIIHVCQGTYTDNITFPINCIYYVTSDALLALAVVLSGTITYTLPGFLYFQNILIGGSLTGVGSAGGGQYLVLNSCLVAGNITCSSSVLSIEAYGPVLGNSPLFDGDFSTPSKLSLVSILGQVFATNTVLDQNVSCGTLYINGCTVSSGVTFDLTNVLGTPAALVIGGQCSFSTWTVTAPNFSHLLLRDSTASLEYQTHPPTLTNLNVINYGFTGPILVEKAFIVGALNNYSGSFSQLLDDGLIQVQGYIGIDPGGIGGSGSFAFDVGWQDLAGFAYTLRVIPVTSTATNTYGQFNVSLAVNGSVPVTWSLVQVTPSTGGAQVHGVISLISVAHP